jgi:hypothetical protein
MTPFDTPISLHFQNGVNSFKFWVSFAPKKRLTINSQSKVTQGATSRLVYNMKVLGQALPYLLSYDIE